MNRVRSSATFLAFALAIAPALAQANPPAQGFLAESPAGGMRTTKLVGVDVIGMDRERIGRTEDIVIDVSGRVQAVVIGVGGFLGIGEKRIAVPFDQVTWNWGEGSGPATPARSSTNTANAPSSETAATSGPSTMPGAQVSNDVLATIDEKRGGAVDERTGSVLAADHSRGRATAPVGDAGEGPVRAEVRLTKAALQAAPTYRP